MPINLFIGYDLMREGQNYQAVTDAIENLGAWARVQQSLYYVNTYLTMEQATEQVRRAMDQNDKLIVIQAQRAHQFNLPAEVAKQMSDYWNR